MVPARRPAPKEVFLSHSSADRRFADTLAAVLRRHGVLYWYSARHIVAAAQWHDEIGKALDRCDWFVVILSPGSVSSEWVNRELAYALDNKQYHERIVPVLRKRCEWQRLSWTLGALQMVDFTGDFHVGCRNLLRIWGLGYRTEAQRGGKRARRGGSSGRPGRSTIGGKQKR